MLDPGPKTNTNKKNTHPPGLKDSIKIRKNDMGSLGIRKIDEHEHHPKNHIPVARAPEATTNFTKA